MMQARTKYVYIKGLNNFSGMCVCILFCFFITLIQNRYSDFPGINYNGQIRIGFDSRCGSPPKMCPSRLLKNCYMSDKTVSYITIFPVVSSLEETWTYCRLQHVLTEPRQANLCLRAFRHDKF